MGNCIAHELTLGNVTAYMTVSSRYGIVSIEVKEDITGRTLNDLDIGPRGKDSVGALLIRRRNEIILSPSLSEPVKTGVILILAGMDEKLEEFLNKTVNKK